MDWIQNLSAFCPSCLQEQADQQAMLAYIAKNADAVLGRQDTVAHMTASAFVINETAGKILMVYHTQMDRWAWPGGHADGCNDLLQVALRETWEETGVHARPLRQDIASLDIFAVQPHIKHGQYVNRHLHFSAAFILVADDTDRLQLCPAENTGVQWQTADFLTAAHFCPEDVTLYQKLLCRARQWQHGC